MSRGLARLALATLLAAGLGGCSLWRGGGGVPADESFGVEIVDGPAVVEFHRRASTFYGRLAQRRFNVIATFRDQLLPIEQSFVPPIAALASLIVVADRLNE